MRPGVRWLVSLAALAFIATATNAGAAGAGKSIKWLSDFKKAQSSAARQKKIILIDFYTDH